MTGDVGGTTQNPKQFSPLGTIVLNAGTGKIEAMSDDRGAVSAGFVDNFAYGTLSLSPYASYSLVDRAKNATGARRKRSTSTS